MLDDSAVAALARGEYGDPFAVLGPHPDADGRLWIRCFLPNARRVGVIDGATGNRVCPLVIVVIRWPIRTLSGRSLSKNGCKPGL